MGSETSIISPLSDNDLVAASLQGNRDAFAEIVRRYQSLICSLAYNATGSLSESEDLAQETFLIAWRELKQLRDGEKVRPWVCGIARNLIANAVRRQGRQPVHRAESLETVSELATEQLSASEGVIREEEEQILWRSLERIPGNYREPLILFYREGESVARVAEQLELSEEAVKQRLSRGRKMLADEVALFVEGALRQSVPGRAFTAGVLASLPVFATSAAAATVSAGAVKGGVVAKSSGIVAVFTAWMGPIAGVLGAFLGIRASLKATRTPRERAFVIKSAKLSIMAAIVFNLTLFAFIFAAVNYWKRYPILFGILGVVLPLTFVLWIIRAAVESNRQFRELRTQEKALHPEMYEAEILNDSAGHEYRSRRTLFGLPLIHVCNGVRLNGRTKPAIGWIALGERAYGVMFAAGAVAVGGISMGGISIGVVALGGASLGILAIAGMAVGGLAIGGAALGVIAIGGLATGLVAAQGGLAIAGSYALGGAATAQYANDDVAREFFKSFSWANIGNPKHRSLFIFLSWSPLLLFLLPLFRRKKKPVRLA